MSTKLINYFNFRQFGVKLFGNLALIHSVVWRYKAPPTKRHVPDAKRRHDVIISAGWLLLCVIGSAGLAMFFNVTASQQGVQSVFYGCKADVRA